MEEVAQCNRNLFYQVYKIGGRACADSGRIVAGRAARGPESRRVAARRGRTEAA